MSTLNQLADLVAGHVLGDGSIEIASAAVIADAGPGDITLVDKPERLKLLAGCRAAAVVVPHGAAPPDRAAIVVENVHSAFTSILLHFRPQRTSSRGGVSPAAHVDPTARLGPDVEVHAGAVIGADVSIGPGSTIHSGVRIMAGCRIGDEVTIYPNVVLYEDSVVGPRCILHAAAVIGCMGFGYGLVDGRHQRSAQLGYVEIEADVEIGACTTIDRGTYGATRIGQGTKIDNQVMVAHNCRIGRHNLICSQVGIAGSTTTGDYVTMAGQVGVRDHVHIGAQSILGAKAGVSNDVPEKSFYLGIPATPQRDQKIKQAALSKLPEMRREMKLLQRQVEELTQKLASMPEPQQRNQSAA